MRRMQEVIRIVVTLCLLIYVSALWFPYQRFAITPGLDPSWVYALNLAAAQHLIFGKDLVFAYGPLGYLWNPMPLGNNLTFGLLFSLIWFFIFVTALASIAFRTSLPQFIVAVVGLSLSVAFGLGAVERSLIALILLGIVALFGRQPLLMFLMGAATAILFFVQMGHGIMCGTILGAFMLMLVLQDRRMFLKSLVFATVGIFVATATVVVFHFKAWGNFSSWIGYAREVVGGYDSGMAMPGKGFELPVALVGSVIFLSPCVLLFRRRSALGLFNLALIPLLFLSFKHSFVRQDYGHVSIYLAVLVALSAVGSLLSESKDWLVAVGIGILLIGLEGYRESKNHERDAASILAGLVPRTQLEVFRRDFQMDKTKRLLLEAGRQSLEADRIPESWLTQIGTGVVTVLSNELTICPANQLNCRFVPVLQPYAAYTSILDRWNAEFFKRGDRPDWIIADLMNIDWRNPWLDAPNTWRAVVSHYEVFSIDGASKRGLLKRRRVGLAWSSTHLRVDDLPLNEWISIPKTDGLIMASMQIDLNLLGKLRRFLYYAPGLVIEVEFANGIRKRWHFIPENVRDDVILGVVPSSIDGLIRFPDPTAEDLVSRVRVEAESRFFKRYSRIHWKILNSEG